MEPLNIGDLVNVAGDGPRLDGIVFETLSKSKVVVAVVAPGRGPSFRTVHPSALTERTEEAADDRALRLLMRRTPPPMRTTARSGAGGARGSRGHSRPPVHRTTGR